MFVLETTPATLAQIERRRHCCSLISESRRRLVLAWLPRENGDRLARQGRFDDGVNAMQYLFSYLGIVQVSAHELWAHIAENQGVEVRRAAELQLNDSNERYYHAKNAEQPGIYWGR